MQLGRTDVISVTLLFTDVIASAVVPMTPESSPDSPSLALPFAPLTATPVPVHTHRAVDGTPGPIQLAFGPEYDTVAEANLSGAAFKTQLRGPTQHPIDQPSMVWEWTVLPDAEGQQTILLGILLRWTRRGSGQTIQREIWEGHYNINVKEPLIKRGHITILEGIGLALILTSIVFPGAKWLYQTCFKKA